MFKLISKELLDNKVQNSILSTEEVGKDAFKSFVNERIIGDGNLWDKMSKVKLLTWNAGTKEMQLKAGSEVLTLKATSTLFARMLLIARSSRDDINLEEVIGVHEFSQVNGTLMQADGNLHPTTDKSTVIHLLEGLVESGSSELPAEEQSAATLIVDGMAVVQELMAVKNFKNAKELGKAYVKLVDAKAQGYDSIRVIFDNYTKETSVKEITRERRRGKLKEIRSFKVEDSTQIKDKTMFLASNITKDSLTIYLAQQLIDNSTVKVVTATRMDVLVNHDTVVTTNVSTQEEADTIMILHALEIAASGGTVHIYSQDTDVLLLALRRVPQLGQNPVMIMGTAERRRKIVLQPIYDALGSRRAAALVNWHALTGCDTTGHIRGKGKATCFNIFMAAGPKVISSLSKLGLGNEPTTEVIAGCEEFLCSLFCPKKEKISKADKLRWNLFKHLKPEQGVDKLPPTPGAWMQHIRRAHYQANIWSQDIIEDPVSLNPLTLGWKEDNGKLMPLLSREAPAPESVLQLVKCGCGANSKKAMKCTARCSCKKHKMACTELCNCGGEEDICANTSFLLVEDDEEEEEY